MSKRLLLIGYYTVDANMGGVRLRRIARRLPRYGWEPVVLTHPPEPGAPATGGLHLEAVAAPDLTEMYTRVRRLGRSHPAAEPAAGRKEPTVKTIGLTSTLNRWVMIPDKQITWYRAALRRGRDLLRRERFEGIFASLEPRTNLLVAARLAKETGLPCVMEYRDLWTGSPYYHLAQPTPLHRWLHAALERKALRQADRVSAVCRGIADYLARQHASVLRAPIELNYNFFDPDEYPAVSPADAGRPFTISYTGAMYGQRSPHQFFEGMRAFIDQAGVTPGQFRFRWAGAISGIEGLAKVLDRTGVRPYMDFLGQIPHREALRQLLQSDAALLLQAPGDAIHIPGKLFEALGARVPLLALAHPCEVTEILSRCRAGIICPHTADSVAAALAQFYGLYRQQQRWDFDEAAVQQFSADAAVSRLARLFDQVLVP